jgi:hypothetical protein
MKKHPTQRGQALILVALAIVGLVGFTALAIDGSIVFSNHRHSQNASDTAAYAGALSYVRDTAGTWKQDALKRAADNGYSAADGITEVDVFLCSDLPQTVNGRQLDCEALPSGAVKSDYIYVHIKSRVDLFFARVLGWRDFTDHTDAVVLADTPKETSFFPGYAIVSTMLGCPAYNHDPFTVAGHSVTTIIDAGILVNSNCSSPQPAYDQYGSSHVDTTTGVCVVGRAESTDTDPPPTEGCSPIDYTKYSLIVPACTHEGSIRKVKDGEYLAYPGNYGPGYAFNSIDDIHPSGGTIKLQKGIYCLHDGIDLRSTWTITSDLDGDGHESSEGVLLYVQDGDLTFNGSSTIDLHAINSTVDDFPEKLLNYLIYVPPSNHADIKVTGSNGSTYTGTILAPTSYIVLNGGSGSTAGTIDIGSQIIGYAVTIEGNGTLNVHYDADDNAVTTYNPSLSGIK